jgi:hypothetical protein
MNFFKDHVLGIFILGVLASLAATAIWTYVEHHSLLAIRAPHLSTELKNLHPDVGESGVLPTNRGDPATTASEAPMEVASQQDYGGQPSAADIAELRAKCSNHDGESCDILGIDYQYGRGTGIQRDYQKAMQFLKQGCAYRNAASCGDVGDLYAKGLGVEQNYSVAYGWYKKYCDAGYPTGCEWMNAAKVHQLNH